MRCSGAKGRETLGVAPRTALLISCDKMTSNQRRAGLTAGCQQPAGCIPHFIKNHHLDNFTQVPSGRPPFQRADLLLSSSKGRVPSDSGRQGGLARCASHHLESVITTHLGAVWRRHFSIHVGAKGETRDRAQHPPSAAWWFHRVSAWGKGLRAPAGAARSPESASHSSGSTERQKVPHSREKAQAVSLLRSPGLSAPLWCSNKAS